MNRLLGQSVARLEDPPLLTGRGPFIGDVGFPHQLHMCIARSPHANAVVRSVDIARALAAPGVVALWTAADIRYTHRIAIANSRLIAFDGERVTFKWKDYRAKTAARYKLMTLDADEFVRRFLIHVLPNGFHRIRHYGLFANGGRAENIARARRLLNVPAPQNAPSDADSTGDGDPRALSHLCPCCGGRMIIIEIFERGCAPRYHPTVPDRVDSS